MTFEISLIEYYSTCNLWGEGWWGVVSDWGYCWGYWINEFCDRVQRKTYKKTKAGKKKNERQRRKPRRPCEPRKNPGVKTSRIFKRIKISSGWKFKTKTFQRWKFKRKNIGLKKRAKAEQFPKNKGNKNKREPWQIQKRNSCISTEHTTEDKSL